MDDNSDGDREAGDFDRYFDVDEMSEWLRLKAKIPQEFCDILRSKSDSIEIHSLFFTRYLILQKTSLTVWSLKI